MRPIDCDIDLRRWRTDDGESNAEQIQRLLVHLPRVMEEELTERQRQIITMHFYQELTVTEIARRLGVNPSTVSRSLQRSAQKLQRFLRCTV